jgi:hypothetical protein
VGLANLCPVAISDGRPYCDNLSAPPNFRLARNLKVAERSRTQPPLNVHDGRFYVHG